MQHVSLVQVSMIVFHLTQEASEYSRKLYAPTQQFNLTAMHGLHYSFHQSVTSTWQCLAIQQKHVHQDLNYVQGH